MLRKRTDTPELREYWRFVEKTAADVASWPAWKRGEVAKQPPASQSSDSTSPAASDKKDEQS